MRKCFVAIYDYLVKHRLLMWVILVLLVVGAIISVGRLNFSEDISDFLPQNAQNEKINYAYEHIGLANTILISVSMADAQAEPDDDVIMNSIDALVEKLEDGSAAEHINKITYQVDQSTILSVMNFVTANIPYFLSDEDYVRLDTMLTYGKIYGTLEAEKRLLMTPVGGFMKNNISIDPLSISGPVLANLNNFKMSDAYLMKDDYIFSKDGREGIITVDSKYPVSETAGNTRLIAAIDQAVREVVAQEDGIIAIEPFGSSYVSNTNYSQIMKDSILSVILAVVIILGLLIYYFRRLGSVIVILLPILFGALFALGCIALLSDKVSIIAISVGSIMIGIAANYPLHYLTHRYQGYSNRETLNDITQPLTTGNITTVGAFLSLLFISSGAMRDLGLFASLLLVGTILFVLIFLPHIVGKVRTREGKLAFRHIASLRFENSKVSIIAVVVITIFLSFFQGRVKFDSNMSNINYMTKEQHLQMDKLMQNLQGGKHLVYYVNQGETIDEALRYYESTYTQVQNVVNSTDSSATISRIGNFIPSLEMQEQRLAHWTSFWKEKAPYVIENLGKAGSELGFKEGAFAPFEEMVTSHHEVQEYDYFEPLTAQFGSSYIVQNHDNAIIYSAIHIDSDKSLNLIDDLNTVSPDRGFSFDAGYVTRAMVKNLSDDFDFVLYICGFIVFAFLLLSFSRIELTVISFLPLAVGWVWILGIMGLFGLNFNIINVILATFIFGMGDDYSIFVTEGMLYENAYNRKMLDTYKDAITLSALIMFAGIGTLIFAKHPAMRSLAQVTIIGMFTVVLMSYIITPFIFKWLTVRKGKRRTEPITLTNWAISIISFAVFLIASAVMTVSGWFILSIGGRSDKHKLKYHKILQRISSWLIRIIPRTKFTYDNLSGETFDKPAVYIANHQSHLDLVAVMMLTPKMIIITNDWVWNSPFYGQIIRYADFFSMDDFMTKDIAHIRKMVDKGYSVMVFPEGTRSLDCSILRFHKGAFYLAQEMGLDIVPLLLHGFGYVLPKDSMLMRKGQMSLSVMERISPTDTEYGDSYSARTKSIRKMYTSLYAQKCAEVETAGYYKNRVLHNYIYKGAEVEKDARRVLFGNGDLEQRLEKLPETGSVLIQETGRGEFSLLAALVRKKLEIFALIEDEQKRSLADNCASKPLNLHYIASKEEYQI